MSTTCQCTCEHHRNNLSGRIALAVSVLALVAATTGTAIAATGGTFLLGKKNTASSTTSLKSERGPALKLTATGSPPLAVSNRKRVSRLNADLIDGIDSSSFALKSQQVLPNWAGYQIMFAGFGCPPGTWSYAPGDYGAEDKSAASRGLFPYKVEWDPVFSTYRLAKGNWETLQMTACTISPVN